MRIYSNDHERKYPNLLKRLGIKIKKKQISSKNYKKHANFFKGPRKTHKFVKGSQKTCSFCQEILKEF